MNSLPNLSVRLSVALTVSLLLVIGAVSTGFLAVPAQIRSRSFIVVDSAGRDVAYMGQSPYGGGSFGLLNASGDTVLGGLVGEMGGASLFLADKDGRYKIMAVVDYTGTGTIYVIDSTSHMRAVTLRELGR